MLGLPDHVHAGLFDLDGVLTKTATVHAAAWKEMFDGFLRRRAAETGGPFVPFDAHDDYDRYVDGRPRADGVRSFLASRGIELPEGSLPLWHESWIMYVRPALSVPARSARTSTVTVAGDPSGAVAELPTPVKSGPCFAVG